MKTDFSKLPREEIEARIATMLMGEMSAEEVRELMEFVAGDAELLRLHDELKATISLVAEASVPEEAMALSDRRRETLLQAFKTVKAPELREERGSGIRTWAALAAMVVFLLGSAIVLTTRTVSRSSVAKYQHGMTVASAPADRGRVMARSDIETAEKLKDVARNRGERELPRSTLASGAEAPALSKPDMNAALAEKEGRAVDKFGILGQSGANSLAQKIEETVTPMAARGTKIELPALSAADADSRAKETWAFKSEGLGRGFGEANNATPVAPSKPGASSSALAYRPADLGDAGKNENATLPDGFVVFGATDANGIDAVTGLPVKAGKDVVAQNEPQEASLVTEPEFVGVLRDSEAGAKKQGAGQGPIETGATLVAGQSGRGIAPAGRLAGDEPAVALNLQESDQKKIGDEVVVENSGAMGGGGMSSMQYYMQNPELMKRYFPQTSGAGFGGYGGRYGGFRGTPDLAANPDANAAAQRPTAPGVRTPPIGIDRNRMMIPQPAAAPAENKPEQKVELGGKVAQIERKPGELLTSRTAELKKENIQTSKEVQEARGLIESGRLSEAEPLLKRAVKEDPEHRAAHYYLDLVEEQKNSQLASASAAPVGRELNRNDSLGREALADVAAKKPIANPLIPQPEVLTAENAFSTFSLNVSDVSFKLAAASLEKGLMPEAASVRSEEFINAFDYRDPEPQGAPVGFVSERARYPFAQDRDLVRFSVKTAARGREAGRPLNLVLLLDSSGSMERADRVRILQECLKTLAAQLKPEDTVSVVAFARTARLWVDGLPGSQAGELAQRVGNLTPEGGTNLEEAMKVAYETARKHFNAAGVNRVVLLTDGAANLGDVEPESLKRKVEDERKRGVALDCFGIGWDGLNDELLETLSRNGDGRYGFVNTPEAAGSEFAGQLAGALQVAASDAKVQVEWNPKRVTAFRQIGYAKHQLTKEQFRDNTVDAAELGAAEAGNALYVVQVNSTGEGPLGTVRVRFKVPGTNDYRENAWTVDYDGASKSLETSSYALRLAATASAFSEWLASNPYAAEVTTERLLSIFSGVPEHFEPDPRPKKLEWMIRQAKSVAGK